MERFFLVGLVLLILAPSVSAMEFSGDIGVMSCTSGWTDLNILIKEPAGRFVRLEGFQKNLSVTLKDLISPTVGVYSYSYSYSGDVDTEGLAPGRYRVVAAAPFTCYNMYGVPYDHRGTAVKYETFQIDASNPLLDNWNWSTGFSGGWNSRGFDDSSWSADTSAGWKGLYWHCSSKDWYGRCQSWEMKGSDRAYFRKSFHLDELAPMDLLVDNNQQTECWINGESVEVRDRVDITQYLDKGENLVACQVSSRFDKKAENLHGYWSFHVPEVGCTIHCQQSDCTSFTCGDSNTKCEKHDRNGFWRWDCYKPTKARFNSKVAFHKESDILWSNDNRSWHYSQLPLEEDSWYLEKPDYYNPDGSVYTGIMPWLGEGLFLRKWIFPEKGQGILRVSSTTEPVCTINGMPLAFQETGDEWWVYRSEVSGLNVGEQSLVSCYSPKSDYYSLFDMEFREASIGASVSSPFEPVSGDSGSGTSATPASDSIPVAPIAGSIIAVSAIGAVGIIRKPSGKNSAFWKKVMEKKTIYQTRLDKIKKENREWEEWQEYTRKWYRERSISLEKAKVHAFLAGLTGTFSERLEAIREWRKNERISFRGTEELLTNTILYYSALSEMGSRVEEYKKSEKGEVNMEQIELALAAFRGLDMEKLILPAITPSIFMKAWNEWVEYIRYNNSLAEGERYKDSPKAHWGIIFSSVGSAVMDISETLGTAGSALMLIGGAASLKFPVAAGVFALGARINHLSMVSYTFAAIFKSIGDGLQSWVCSEKGDNACVENANRKVQWNVINGLVNIATAGAPRVIKFISPNFIKKLEDMIGKLIRVKNPGDGLGDSVLKGFMEMMNDIILEPFKGLNIKIDSEPPNNKY